MVLIRTDRLQLRDFMLEDFSAVQAYAADPIVTQYLSWGPNDDAMTREFLSVAATESNTIPRVNYSLAAVLSLNDQLIGGCGLLARRLQYSEYEIGYCLSRAYWGHGYGTEIVKGLLKFGFATVKAHRIFASVDPRNSGSCRLLEKTGFRLEGLQRSDTFVRGKWCDSSIFAILLEEWTSQSG
jgi:RimJ/RimL family protein N-acetyltransferase